MIIRRLWWQAYRVPYGAMLTTANAAEPARDGIILGIETDGGVTGIGEASPLRSYAGGTIKETMRYPAGAPMPAGSVLSVTFELFGQTYIAMNGGPSFTFAQGFSLMVQVDTQEEIDRLWTTLTANGGKPVQCGWLVDQFGEPIAFEFLEARMGERKPGDPSTHPVWRDPQAALMSTQRLVRLAETHRKRVHVLHISTGEEMDFLAQHRDWASVEVTPHHLTLVAPDCYRRLGTYAQMNPPVRDQAHQDRIWQGVIDGTVDVLGSDHAPHTREEKDHAYPASHSGMTGVQTLVPIMLDHVNRGRITLERFVDLTSHGPNRLFGLRGKGRIAMGYDADFTIVDMKKQQTIRNADVQSRAGWTPYDGVTVTGWPIGTIIRGNRVMWEGTLAPTAHGQPVRFFV